MDKPAPDFDKEPWKHPAVWKSHLVRMTRDYPDDIPYSVATCECGWQNRVKVNRLKSVKEQDASVHTHWHEVIKASAVPA